MGKEMITGTPDLNVRIPTEVADLDGDFFENRPMTADEWAIIRDYIKEHPKYQYLLNKDEPFLIYQAVIDETQASGEPTINIFLASGVDTELEQIAFCTKEGDIYEPPEQSPNRQFCWRPILRPLTKEMQPDNSFRQENPMGSEMTGGHILVNGAARGFLPNQTHIPLQIGGDGKDLSILSTGDAAEDPICWVSFGNILFPKHALARITLHTLAHIGRVPYPEDWTEIPRSEND